MLAADGQTAKRSVVPKNWKKRKELEGRVI
jgi:hypothetical protein